MKIKLVVLFYHLSILAYGFDDSLVYKKVNWGVNTGFIFQNNILDIKEGNINQLKSPYTHSFMPGFHITFNINEKTAIETGLQFSKYKFKYQLISDNNLGNNEIPNHFEHENEVSHNFLLVPITYAYRHKLNQSSFLKLNLGFTVRYTRLAYEKYMYFYTQQPFFDSLPPPQLMLITDSEYLIKKFHINPYIKIGFEKIINKKYQDIVGFSLIYSLPLGNIINSDFNVFPNTNEKVVANYRYQGNYFGFSLYYSLSLKNYREVKLRKSLEKNN